MMKELTKEYMAILEPNKGILHTSLCVKTHDCIKDYVSLHHWNFLKIGEPSKEKVGELWSALHSLGYRCVKVTLSMSEI